jgi:GNAT superfamily N-acetyltransferase
VWLVAEVDGQVVGDVSARLERPAEDAERQVLRYLGEVRIDVAVLGVVQAHRRRGVGRRLMGAIERWARERGAGCAMLDTKVLGDRTTVVALLPSALGGRPGEGGPDLRCHGRLVLLGRAAR